MTLISSEGEGLVDLAVSLLPVLWIAKTIYLEPCDSKTLVKSLGPI